ncbi:MAG: ATPase, T2SS/T4P/T4SS family [Planctomycetota bacterium]
MSDGTLSAQDAQQQLGISPATFYRWVRDGRLRGVRVGRRWQFTQAAIDALRTDATGDAQRRAGLDQALHHLRERVLALGISPEKADDMIDGMDDVDGAVQLLVEHALTRTASDVHLAPVAGGLRVRERIDGKLLDVGAPLPEASRRELVRALKRWGGLRPEVEDRPQDGRFFVEHDARQVDVRVSSFPTGLGEALTLRLLDPRRMTVDLERLGLTPQVLEALREATRRSHGVLLVNGPAGSGKSTTLYALLDHHRQAGVRVMTVEDPVELYLDGMLQAQVSDALSFTDAMRAMLRNDLDVGMVAELRDPEAIQLLYTMAGAGHLMFSALHAATGVEALQRVLELGAVAPRLVAELTLGVLSQRLVPKACPACARVEALGAAAARRLELPEDLEVVRAPGCASCEHSGARGRTAAAAFLEPTRAEREALAQGTPVAEALSQPPERTLLGALQALVRAQVVTPEAAVTAAGR